MKIKIISCLLAAVFLCGCAGKSYDPTKPTPPKLQSTRPTTNTKGINWDLSLKRSYYPQSIDAMRKKGMGIDSDTAMLSRLQKIMNRLKENTLIPDLPYEVHYIDHETVNAVCYPGGGIIFFRGLFDKEKGLVNPSDDDEIAAVMAHEMAHANLRHSYKQYNSRLLVTLLGTLAITAAGAAGGAPVGDLMQSVFDIGTGLYFPSYSRKHESEADLEAVYLMMKAGYDPEKSIGLWERASQRKGGNKSSIFSTHPGSLKRANDLRYHIEKIKSPAEQQ